jgi:hypothetical protein
MKPGKFYIHSNFKDCYVEVLQVKQLSNGSQAVQLQLWNLGFTGTPFLVPSGSGLPFSQFKTFTAEELLQWRRFFPYSEWKSVRNTQFGVQLFK